MRLRIIKFNKQKKMKVNAPRIVVFSFLIAILAGTLLLSLPIATRQPGSMHPVNALFTATSATCVTGLVVKDTGAFFTPFGQIIILILIQLGGLGIMTMSTFFMLLLGKRISLKDRIVLQDTVGKTRVAGLRGLIKRIVIATFSLELVGALFLGWRFHKYYGYALPQAITHGLFHSISAFCNAGFSLYRDSLMRFADDWWITSTMGALVFLGGIGFVVLFNITHFYFWRKNRLTRGRLRLHSKLALLTSAALIIIMFVSLLGGEWNNTLRGIPLGHKISRSLYQAITPRTAGFNTMPVNKLKPASNWITIFMMFVGASPGSTGGGIKTVTFVVLLASVYALITEKKEVTIFRKTIREETVLEAISIGIISLGVVFVSCTLLIITESANIASTNEGGFMNDIIFEVVSAFGTVGLSNGITPHLSFLGKLIISATVFVGRVSPLALALLIGRRGPQPVRIKYPEETVLVG